MRLEKEEFIKRLVALRQQKNVSAREMSLSLGMSENYINSLENGAALPNMTAFFFICDYLGITPQEFFDEQVPPQNKRLYELIMKLPGDYVARLTDLVETALQHMN